MEFTTAVEYQMNITLVLLVNSELGKISKSSAPPSTTSGRPGSTTPILLISPTAAAAWAFGYHGQRNWTMPFARHSIMTGPR